MGGGAVRRKKDLPVAISMSLTCMNAHWILLHSVT
jgi:hypothetical protein